MSTLHLSLPEQLRQQAELRAAESGYTTVEEYVQSLIEADAQQLAQAELESLLIDRLDRGKSIVMDDSDFVRIRQRVEDEIARRATRANA